ncbi:MAG TPA: alpha-galactosidase [Candidatus Limnocylindrales bacterium]
MKWALHGANTSYVVRLVDKRVLALDYWGPKDGVTAWPERSTRLSYQTEADLAPLEYASTGTRHIHQSELMPEHDDGTVGAVWSYVDDVFDENRLSVRFTDDTGRLELTQHTLLHKDSDVVERWVDIRNVSTDHSVRLSRVLSAAWSVHAPQGARLHYLSGSARREFEREVVELKHGMLRIGSRCGVTGYLFQPVMSVEAVGRPGAYGIALAWSGSWMMTAEGHPGGLMRVSAGIDDETTTIRLTPGRVFTTPHSLGVYSAEGTDGVSRAWHLHQRRSSPRSVAPVVYNSWFATRFDVRPEHQLELARTAAEIGVETFVVDDGWFKGRSTDRAGLGDWEADPESFPDGLAPFAEAVTALGMRFGLWVELEGVNLDSDLYRAHPEWAYTMGDRPPVVMRHQLVLNLGLPAVREHLAGVVRRLLTGLPISYLKWDLNRPITDTGPADTEWAVAHVEGYYGLLRLLRTEFPHVTVEGCAGGGARIDPAVTELVDVVWPSDETGPRDRLVIQDGFLRAYPPHLMSSWVTHLPGERWPEPASDGFRFVTSMAGVLGIGADISRWTPEQVEAAARAVALYKELRPVLHGGEVFVHGEPTGGTYAVEYVTPGRIVVLVWDTGNGRAARIRLSGADPSASYRVRAPGGEYSGADLRRRGIPVTWTFAPDADVIVLDRL